MPLFVPAYAGADCYHAAFHKLSQASEVAWISD